MHNILMKNNHSFQNKNYWKESHCFTVLQISLMFDLKEGTWILISTFSFTAFILNLFIYGKVYFAMNAEAHFTLVSTERPSFYTHLCSHPVSHYFVLLFP